MSAPTTPTVVAATLPPGALDAAHPSAPSAVDAPASAGQAVPAATVTGKVRWFNETKGYGFIADDATGKDVFVHYAVIQTEGFKTLRDGEDVRFEMEQTPKGSRAVRVWRVARDVH